jgi:phosphoribosylglycinamide formyltransferase-1
MFDAIRRSGARWVIMGGYLEHLLIPNDFENRVVNIHPSLIPAFCGKGMYGLRVHQAAIDFGVKISGCTVHFVDNQYDHGPILLQRACEVLEGDTAETLQKRVFELECEALPEAIARIAMAQGTSS